MSERVSDRIINRLTVYTALDDVYDQAGAHRWMHRPNRRLNGRTPAQAISDGDTSEVLRIVTDLGGGPKKSPPVTDDDGEQEHESTTTSA